MVMIVVFPEIQVRLHMVMISKLPGCFFVGRVEEVEQLAQRYPDDREAEIFMRSCSTPRRQRRSTAPLSICSLIEHARLAQAFEKAVANFFDVRNVVARPSKREIGSHAEQLGQRFCRRVVRPLRACCGNKMHVDP